MEQIPQFQSALKTEIEELKKIKRERDNSKLQACLDRLKVAAAGEENLMPYLIECAKAYASLGEITNSLKEVWGSYKEMARLGL